MRTRADPLREHSRLPASPTRDEDDATQVTEKHADDLSAYLHDVHVHGDLLGPEGEVALGKRVEALDVALARRVLGHAPRPEFVRQLVLEHTAVDLGRGRASAKSVAEAVTLLRASDMRLVPVMLRTLFRPPLDPALDDLRASCARDWGEVSRLRDQFVVANLRLVVRVAKTFARRVPLPDAIQDGNVGLMKAVEKWDYRRGYRFSTYATWWIRQGIERAYKEVGSTVRLPVHVRDTLGRVAHARKILTDRLGRDPSVAELADQLRMPLGKVEHLLSLKSTLSLDAPIAVGNDSLGEGHLLDVLADEKESVEESIVREGDRRVLRAALGKLSQAHRQVIEARMARRTLKSIGEERDVSRERIRQIEEKAEARLRHHVLHPGSRPDPDYARERGEAMDRVLSMLRKTEWARRADIDLAMRATVPGNARNWLSQLVRRGAVVRQGEWYRLATEH